MLNKFIINSLLAITVTTVVAEEKKSCCGVLPKRVPIPNAKAEVKKSGCAVLPKRVAIPKEEGMIWIKPGQFTMGCVTPPAQTDEQPLHQVKLDGFWISETPITNKQFAEFVKATNYVTTCEKKPDEAELLKQLPPGTKIPAEYLIPASLVFSPPGYDVPLNNPLVWWRWQAKANWRQPEGPGSSIEGKDDHPVVHVSWFDAEAYAKWAGASLPTEAQWEYAARGGLDQKKYVWGDSPVTEGPQKTNIWQGKFPNENTVKDGFESTSPVKQYPPNGYGLYDMAGNVWEWVADWYHPDSYKENAKQKVSINPTGMKTSFDPQEPLVQKKVTRGGSFLCNDSYCSGYRPSARMKTSPDTSLNHTGFRVVKNIKKK